jgi:hypothetical protein
MKDLIDRVREYAGKTRNQVRSAHITARETIEIANHIVRIESEYLALRTACEELISDYYSIGVESPDYEKLQELLK